MNYELANELKKAGFLLKTCDVGPDCEQWWYYPHKDAIHVPTLSELIEACNPTKADEFWLGTSTDVWEAGLNYHGYFDYPIKFKDDDGFASVELKEEGPTPEEAVARLWLAINAKQPDVPAV